MSRQLWIADRIRSYGVQVIEHNGWQSRGSETFTPRGVVCHHTASNAGGGDAPALNICINGRSDLPGPLAQIVLSRSGVAHVIAAGRANHAGNGGWNGLSGNSSVFGIEAENNGVGEPWPAAQVEAYARIVAALCSGASINVDMVCGHKEWAPSRKIDPRGIDMNDFRNRVRSVLSGAPVPVSPPPATNIYKIGSTGEKVRDIQAACNFWGWNAGAVDGNFGPSTEAAVRRAQSALKINSDGIWGPATTEAYVRFVAAMKAFNERPTLKRGDKGEWVKVAQKKLGYLTVDGDFGFKTHARVLKIQRLKGLKSDGIIGKATWAVLDTL